MKNENIKFWVVIALLVFIYLLFFLHNVSAEVQSLGTFKQNDCVELSQVCSNCTYVNLTRVEYPNSTKSYIGKFMTKKGTNYNYTFCTTGDLGNYLVSTCGDVDGEETCVVYDFEVTPTGTNLTTGQSIIYFIFLVSAVVIFFISLYYSVKIEWEHQRNEEGYVIGLNDLRWVKIFCMVICYLVLMSIMGLMRGITANFVPEIGVYRLFNWLYWIMFVGVYPIIVCGFVFALINFLTSKKIERALRRGIPTK